MRNRQHSRWLVTVTYRSDEGLIDVYYHIEELYELHKLIENGPRFSAIEKIQINLNEKRRLPNVRVEKASF